MHGNIRECRGMTTSSKGKTFSLEALRSQLTSDLEVSAASESEEYSEDRFKGVEAATITDDFLVCHCSDVTAGELRELISSGGAHSLDEVQRCTRAGGGCGKCIPLLTDLVTIELSKVRTRSEK